MPGNARRSLRVKPIPVTTASPKSCVNSGISHSRDKLR
jgi:hypothetical protein